MSTKFAAVGAWVFAWTLGPRFGALLGNTFFFDNGKWMIEVVGTTSFRMTGWLTNRRNGHQFMFTVFGDKVIYMRALKPHPDAVPKTMEGYLRGLRELLAKD